MTSLDGDLAIDAAGNAYLAWTDNGEAWDLDNNGLRLRLATVAANAPAPTVTKHYYFGSTRVAMRKGGVLYYLHGDHLGSTSLTTDASGGIVAQSRYLPYGQERWTSGPAQTDFTFTGQRNDSFGLSDFNARYYDPYLNRFISPDSVVKGAQNPQTLNHYSLTLNNPLRYTDSTGHWPDLPGAIDAALGAGYQFVNDMAVGIPDIVFGTDWQEEQSAAFQEGQDIGRAASTAVAVVDVAEGLATAASGAALMPPTAGAGAVCTAGSAGACSIPTGFALAGETTVVGAGLGEAAYGGAVLMQSAKNPLQGPRYTSRNFRKNLENRRPKPQGMNNPQAHHILVQALEDKFKGLGINVHDPKWGVWWDEAGHQANKVAFQRAWEKWFANTSSPTVEGVIQEAESLSKQ
jgi:RHS repeat-associated protein